MRNVLLLLAASALLAQNQAPPTFAAYPVSGKFTARPAAPVFANAYERRFRTAIGNAAARGPNFAGHFALAQWGCGGGCVSMAVVDLTNGRIFEAPFETLALSPNAPVDTEPLDFRKNSRLLIARGCPDENEKACATYFYEWKGKHFDLIRKTP